MRSRLPAILFALLFPLTAQAVTLLPLDAEDATILPTGQLEMTIGGQYLDDVQPRFRKIRRDQWSAPEIGINVGLGTRAEVQFRWEALYVREEATSLNPEFGRYGVGDARLYTKIRVFSAGAFGTDWMPATALRFGLKLPNASFNDRLGTDEADFFGTALVSRYVFGAGLFADAGIGILGNPGPTRGQDDVFLYDAAITSPDVARFGDMGLILLGEVAGTAGSRFDDDQSHARVGARLEGRSFAAFVAGSARIDDRSEAYGARFGVVWWLQVFEE